MSELPDESVGLMITSPPYHAAKEYDTDETFDEYLGLLETVFRETQRVLEPGGRMAINAAGLGRKPYVHLPSYVYAVALELGFYPRGEVIWVKGKGSNGSCAWGTFQKADNPVLRDVHEHIMIFSKGQFGRARVGTSTITRDDFLQCTLSVWYMPPESATRVGHPAPFPVELPRRLIELLSYEDDLILDPFIGAGTTAVAAIRTGRRYAGYDIKPEYIDLAKERCCLEAQQKSERELVG